MSISTPQEQPAQGQDPQSTPAPATTPPVGDGPWATDINLLFDDPAARSKVDSFLRSKVQPYTTQLEQQAASAREAMRLVENLNADPVDTYVAITTEMFGEEAGQAVLGQLQTMLGQKDQPAQQQAPSSPEPQPVDPRLAAVIEYVESQQNNAYYENEISRVVREHPEIDQDLFHPFVAAANGDFDAAVSIYNTWLADYGTKYAIDPTKTLASQAPAVMGSDTQTAQASGTPVAPRKQTLDEALDDFMSEQRANRQAPPVGSA